MNNKTINENTLKLLQSGTWIAQFPFGYTKSKEICPINSIICIDIFTLYSKGSIGFDLLLNYIYKKYNKIFSKAGVRNILSNKFYIGIMTCNGVEFPHKYPTFISKQLFDKCQSAFTKPTGDGFYAKKRREREANPNPIKSWELLKLERGECLGTVPFGYKVINKTRTKYANSGQGVVCQESSKIVMEIFKLYSLGNISTSHLHLYINDKYKSDIARSNINKILKNRFYIGFMKWKGKEFKHSYETFISQELFDRCQLILKSNDRYGKNIIIPKQIYQEPEFEHTYKHLPPAQEIVRLCKKERSIEELAECCELSLSDVQNFVLELEIEGVIKEVGPNTWKTIGVSS